MTAYLLRRVAGFFGLLVGISAITFGVIHLAPGDPASLQTQLNPKASMQARQKMVELYGLDRPLAVQYADWAKRIARFDFGTSFRDGESVLRKIARRIPVTLTINALSLALILAVAIPLGVLGAVTEGSPADRFVTVIVYVGFAAPTFWLALILVSFLGVRLHLLPVSGLVSLEFDYFTPLEKAADLARHLALPVFVSAFTGLAGISRYLRESMIETLKTDYIRAAWSKGLRRRTVLFKHALRNAALPVVTLLGLSLPGLLGGSVIFETIFGIPGLGRLFFDSVYARDYPVIMGILMMGAFLTLAGNFIADLAYFWVDPRIRVRSRA